MIERFGYNANLRVCHEHLWQHPFLFHRKVLVQPALAQELCKLMFCHITILESSYIIKLFGCIVFLEKLYCSIEQSMHIHNL